MPAPLDGLVLAIDLGTSSAKVGVFDPAGALLGFAREPYPVQRTADAVEQDPEDWWAAVVRGVQAVITPERRRALRAVAVGGQGPTLVLVDAEGHAVRPALSWMDSRSAPQAARLAERVEGGRIAYSLVPRMLWAHETEPDRVANARWALQAWDFIAYRLAGAGEHAVASTFAGDVVWWPAALEVAGGDGWRHLVPPHVDAGAAYAETAGRWLAELGLPAGIPVVGGLNDGVGAILGSDGVVVGRATDPGGASGGLALCWDALVEAPGIHAWPGLAPGTFIVGGALAAGGRAVDWWAHASGVDVPSVLDRAAKAPPGADGALFLPFLDGERAPLWDPDVRGGFAGLDLHHDAAHLARAVVESTAYALRLLADATLAAGTHIDELRLCGRQAESPLWNQVKADVTGLPVAVPSVAETSLMCAALCASVGAGMHPNLLAAASAMVRVGERLQPLPERRAVYDAGYQQYWAGYLALKGLSSKFQVPSSKFQV